MIFEHCDPNFLPTVETEGSRMIVILRSFNFLNFPPKKLLKIHSMSSRLSLVLNLNYSLLTLFQTNVWQSHMLQILQNSYVSIHLTEL